MHVLDGYVDGSIESIYHLGLVAGIYDSLQIGTIIVSYLKSGVLI